MKKVLTLFLAYMVSALALLICSTSETLYAQQPDLTVSNVQAPASANTGDMIIIRWTTSNIGTASTIPGSFLYDYIYLSRDLVLNTDDDPIVGGLYHADSIAAGSSEQDSTYAFLPSDSIGTFYVFVVTDGAEMVNESNESNNTAHSSAIIVGNTRPDLRVAQVVVPSSASSSQSINVTYSVANQGTAALTQSSIYDVFVLSTDTTYDSGDQWIGSNVVDTSLDIGESYTLTRSAYLSSSLSGVFYVIVKTNYFGMIPELDLENNTNYSAPIAIDLQRPDLIVTNVNGPTSFRAGERVRYDYTVRNIGDTSTMNRSWNDFVYLSKDTVRDDSDMVVDLREHTANLNAGESVSVSDSFDLPVGLENGTYHLIVITDVINQINESNETNNTGFSGAISYLYTGPDFEITNVDVPSSVSSGSDLTVMYTIRNSGNQPSPPTERTDGIYLSSDSTFDYSDTYLGVTTDANSIAAGQSVLRSTSVSLPLELSGSYYVIVSADMYYRIAEYSELNNTGVSSAMQVVLGSGPDLRVTSVVVPESVATGEQFTVSWDVTNTGSGSTGPGQWYDAVYLSRDTILSGSVLLGSFANLSTLGSGQHYTNTAQVVVPQNYGNDCRIIVIANAARQIAEINSDNNGMYSSLIRISGCNGSDLVATQLAFPSSAQSGQQIEVTWQVQNTGNRATTVPVWQDLLRLSIDTALSQTWSLGSFDNPMYLGPGESYSQTQTVTIPSELNGDYYFVLDVYESRSQIECNSTNNRLRSASPIQISLAPPPDLQVAFIIAPANAFFARLH